MAKVIERVTPLLKGASVCEFGNQRLEKSLQAATGLKTTKEFYISKGFSTYIALDVNERMDATIWDLNYPVDVGVTGQFDLVTDNGTGEHLFNQYAVWDNHHRLTKQGGLLVKIMPFTPWFNHGFYNFNPIFYRDVAAANKYQWLVFWITDRGNFTPKDLDYSPGSVMFKEKRPYELMKYASSKHWQSDLYMVAVWRKIHEEPFQIPIQGKYKKDISDGKLKLNYGDDPR